MKLAFILFMIISKSILAQSDVILKVSDIGSSNDSIILKLEYINASKDNFFIYLINSEDICATIFTLELFDNYSVEVNSNSRRIFPCDYVIDLNAVILNELNTGHLAPNDTIVDIIKLGNLNLPNGDYKLRLKILYNNIEFINMNKNLFVEVIIAEISNFRIH